MFIFIQSILIGNQSIACEGVDGKWVTNSYTEQGFDC